ncbi:MAG: hypothetical protein L0207_03380 [Chlamydiae bacterium]|nr:hypothetical protein [Chlamydiota bacterium]
MKVPSSQEFRKFADFVFTFNPSVTRENLPRLFAQATLATGLALTSWFICKCIMSHCYSINSISNIPAKFFGSEKTILEKIWKEVDTQGIDTTPIKALEIYGSEEITFDKFSQVEKVYLGNAFLSYLKNDEKNYPTKSNTFCNLLLTTHKLAFVKLSPITYPDGSIYVTIDIRKEAVEFNPPNSLTISCEDPKGLLKEFDEYCEKGRKLSKAGEIEKGEENVAGVWHTLFGHSHPDLKPYLEIFTNNTKDFYIYSKLLDIYLSSDDDSQIAKVILLFAYQGTGEGIVETLEYRIDDQNGDIRANVFSVYAFIAEYHPKIELPFLRILSAINDPLTIVRSKALKTLYHYLSHQKDGYITEVELNKIREFIPILKKIQKLQQPNNRYFANEILKVLKDHYGIDINKVENS